MGVKRHKIKAGSDSENCCFFKCLYEFLKSEVKKFVQKSAQFLDFSLESMKYVSR